MKWEDREESSNVEDQRGGGRRGLGLAAGGGGIIIIIIGALLGVDPDLIKRFVGTLEQNAPQAKNDKPLNETPEEHRVAKFSKVVFHDTEVVWDKIFRNAGKEYTKPTLVLFTDQVNSACGSADSAVGPFYCPGDSKVYIDLSFYTDMEKKLGAPGEFARAYVIAHEVGHHVQRLMGYSQRVDEIRRKGNKVESNHASVRLELQADYLAGVWAHHADKALKFIEPGDFESAITAANAIGDDRLQRKARGTVVPDSFTHGTSAQRVRWFTQGFKTGSVSDAKLLFELPYNQL
jgi:predicted metalloprotease